MQPPLFTKTSATAVVRILQVAKDLRQFPILGYGTAFAAVGGATLTFDGQTLYADANGSYAIAATNGTHSLTVSVPGYGTTSVNVTVAGADVVMQDVKLSPEAGTGTATPGSPGFELAAALAGLIIIALCKHGRA